ncbi:hypothetical protein AYO48_03825 [Gaiella sp. SCGC AG-212-M14]|nr:hypothetical protein AYO48_03825 [Gaiella sp. SCGC AG-212-M14]
MSSPRRWVRTSITVIEMKPTIPATKTKDAKAIVMKRSGSICYDPRWGSVRPLSGRDPISVDLRRSSVKWGGNPIGARSCAGQADETAIEARTD